VTAATAATTTTAAAAAATATTSKPQIVAKDPSSRASQTQYQFPKNAKNYDLFLFR
jgi:hypothetical protein